MAKKQARKQQQQKKQPRRSQWVLIGVGVVLVGVAVAAFFAFSGGGDSAPKSRPVRVRPTVTSEMQVAVEVIDNDFTPPSLQIKKGATITWTFKGKIPHNVTEDPGGSTTPFVSDTLTKGEFAHTFDTVGSFTYHCVIHHIMEGTITVTE